MFYNTTTNTYTLTAGTAGEEEVVMAGAAVEQISADGLYMEVELPFFQYEQIHHAAGDGAWGPGIGVGGSGTDYINQTFAEADDDSDSWNYNVTAVDGTGAYDYAYSEYGIYRYAAVNVSWTAVPWGTLNPGDAVATPLNIQSPYVGFVADGWSVAGEHVLNYSSNAEYSIWVNQTSQFWGAGLPQIPLTAVGSPLPGTATLAVQGGIAGLSGLTLLNTPVELADQAANPGDFTLIATGRWEYTNIDWGAPIAYQAWVPVGTLPGYYTANVTYGIHQTESY
jgi:hypothetical protein